VAKRRLVEPVGKTSVPKSKIRAAVKKVHEEHRKREKWLETTSQELGARQYRRNGRGLWVVLEGVDGTGKTTQAELLAKHLKGQGHEIVKTAEPTKETAAGRRIREGITDPQELLHLFVEDRTWHLLNYVYPALNSGFTVIQDRNWLSTAIYQGQCLGSHESVDNGILGIAQAHSLLFPDQPDLVIIFDISLEEAEARSRERSGNQIQQLEDGDIGWRIGAYQQPAMIPSCRDMDIQFVNAGHSIESVQQEVQRIVSVKLAPELNDTKEG